jgi:antitoxin (DNA-binding transcriptional repressor) of toxin-antitoxin stability system
MKLVGAFEAKTHLSRLLDEVARGETITITKHGTPVAQLGPPPEARRKDVRAAIDKWLAYRKEHNIRLDGLTIREMIEEGRRF